MAEVEKSMGAGGGAEKAAEVASLYAQFRAADLSLRRTRLLIPVVLLIIIGIYTWIVIDQVRHFDSNVFLNRIKTEATTLIPEVQKALTSAVMDNRTEIIAAAKSQFEKRLPDVKKAWWDEFEKIKKEYPERLAKIVSAALDEKLTADVQELQKGIPAFTQYLQEEASQQAFKNTNSKLANDLAAEVMARIQQHLDHCQAQVENIVGLLNDPVVQDEIAQYKNDPDLERNFILKLTEVMDRASRK
jgi:hypothetical protein